MFNIVYHYYTVKSVDAYATCALKMCDGYILLL
jgi:hypothetical protein